MKEHCFLGSLAACRDLSEDYAAGKIHCVVSFCAREMRNIRGQPDMEVASTADDRRDADARRRDAD